MEKTGRPFCSAGAATQMVCERARSALRSIANVHAGNNPNVFASSSRSTPVMEICCAIQTTTGGEAMVPFTEGVELLSWHGDAPGSRIADSNWKREEQPNTE